MNNKLITCRLSVLLVFAMLLSLMLPVSALAAEGLEIQNNNSTQDSSSDVSTSFEDDSANSVADTGTENTEIPDITSNNLQPDLPKEVDDAQNSSSNTTSVDSTAGNTNTDDTNEKQTEESTDNVKDEEQAISEGSGGSISSADDRSGSDNSSEDQSSDVFGALTNGVLELFVSAKGDDESADGSEDRPFATINAALEAAGDSNLPVELCLLTDLVITRPVRLNGNTVLLTGSKTVVTITRSADFSPDEIDSSEEQIDSGDAAADHSNPDADVVDNKELVTAMFAVGHPDEEYL